MTKKVFDLLKRPPDWVDIRASRDPLDVSKVRHYVGDDGLEYWVDPNSRSIRTNNADIYMTFHAFSDHAYCGHSYAKLHFDEEFVVITQNYKDPERVVFSPDFQEKSELGEQIWHVDKILQTLRLPDDEAYPWLHPASLMPEIEIRGMCKFRDLDQQNRFIYLVKTLLSCHCGAMGDVLRGEVTRGKVVFGTDLLSKFQSGELIHS